MQDENVCPKKLIIHLALPVQQRAYVCKQVGEDSKLSWLYQ